MMAHGGTASAHRVSTNSSAQRDCPRLHARVNIPLRQQRATALHFSPTRNPARLPRQVRAKVEVRAASPAVEETVPEGDYCMPSQVEVDNHSHPNYTVITLEVKDFPGLFRVLAWVLNGLELTVHNATLDTDASGMVQNCFWLKDVAGRKLSDDQAEMVAERLSDFVMYCTPDLSLMQAETFGIGGPISVDNTQDERFSVITIMATQEQQERGNFLLELTSALNGVGVKIGRCIIQSCKSCGTPVNDPDYPADDENARLYKVWGTDRHGKKLDYARITALLYTVGLVFDKTSLSQTSVPSGTQ